MSLIGTNVTMVGGLAKVTGAINYAPDLVLPRMLYAKALRSPYPHAKLLRVDSTQAERYPGVVAVVTRDDLTGLNPYFGPVVDDQISAQYDDGLLTIILPKHVPQSRRIEVTGTL